MLAGWIKLHRSIEEWKWINNPATLRLWLYCLTHARHEDGNWNGVELKAGQLVIGRKAFEHETGISEQSYRTALRRLKDDGTITTKATNKYTIITVVNWGFYQRGEEKATNEITSEITNEQPANNQQKTTNNNVKNLNNEKRCCCSTPPPPTHRGDATTIIDELAQYCTSAPRIATDANDQKIRQYLHRFLSQGATPDEIKLAVDIVKETNFGGRTSLDRIVWAMRSNDFARLKDWERSAWIQILDRRKSRS